jgi:hypothetical protein
MLNAAIITGALLTALQNDAALQGLMPDGAWHMQAPAGLTKFVIVQLLTAANVGMFGGTAYKDLTYLVEARALSTVGADVESAYDRIVALLTDQPLALTGYGTMLVQFEEDIEFVEVDSVDPSIRWNRCGGHCHVMIAAASS